MKSTAATHAVAAACLLIGTAAPAVAQDYSGQGHAGYVAPGIEGEIGIGVSVAPRFEGSSDFVVNPLPLIRIDRFTLSNGFSLGGGPEMGFSLGPSLNVRAPREAADTPALTGLADVDRAFEIGVEARYEASGMRLHGNLRRGFGGHEGWVGEAGLDFLARPAPDLTLHVGPRVSYADNQYMDTYFSVPAGTANFATFDAGGGFKSVGAEIGARQDFGANWALEGAATYDRLIGDAGASPITDTGTRDQFAVRAGIVRKFRIDF